MENTLDKISLTEILTHLEQKFSNLQDLKEIETVLQKIIEKINKIKNQPKQTPATPQGHKKYDIHDASNDIIEQH